MKKANYLSPTLLASILFWLASPAYAQNDTESLYQQYAPIELTGNWVSVVTEDWHIRMVTPQRGNFEGLALSQQAQQAAMDLDLEALENSGQACMAFGAPALFREPGRLRISWEDAETLRIETDAGEQTRHLYFENLPEQTESSLQGISSAKWLYAGGFDPERSLLNPGQTGGPRSIVPGPSLELAGGKLYVETRHLTPGLLRKNGVPYSGDTILKEYFNTLTEPDGTQWLIITTIVRDPINLLVDHIVSTHFQREPDSSRWNPTPCTLF